MIIRVPWTRAQCKWAALELAVLAAWLFCYYTVGFEVTAVALLVSLLRRGS